MIRSVVLLAVLIAAAGCADDERWPNSMPTDNASLGAAFNCEDPIDVLDELPERFAEFGGVVALPTSNEAGQRGRAGPDNDLDSRRRFSKMGLLVRPGMRFQIHVAPDSQTNAQIDWGNAGDNFPVGSLSMNNCDGDDGTWLAYPGGVWTLDPACVELIVLTAESQASVRLPVGEKCP